jgi:hypothetical protein
MSTSEDGVTHIDVGGDLTVTMTDDTISWHPRSVPEDDVRKRVALYLAASFTRSAELVRANLRLNGNR